MGGLSEPGSPKPKGIMQQPQEGLFALRVRMVAGHISAEGLRAVADAAEQYAGGVVHLTTRQGIEIHDIPEGNLDALVATLGRADLTYGGSGSIVRGIIACPGQRCRYGLIDTQAAAFALTERLRGYTDLPSKFKVAVSGCPNGCTGPQATCLGIMGRARKGADGERCTCYTLFVGGKMGRSPRPAEQLPVEVMDDEVLMDVAASMVEWYRDEGQEKERFANTLERVGMEALMDRLTATTDIMAGG